MVEQMRRGMERLLDIDSDTGIVTRGSLTRNVKCRVSYQSGAVWDYAAGDTGATMDTTPYVLAAHGADIRENDILQWRDRRFQVGLVSRPTLDGGTVCLQAQLREVRNDT
jgi:hypothetical protein